MPIKAFRWYVLSACHSNLPTADVTQISVVADMVALPTYMAESLVKAKGSYGHSALNMAKAVVQGTAGSLSSKEDDKKVDY